MGLFDRLFGRKKPADGNEPDGKPEKYGADGAPKIGDSVKSEGAGKSEFSDKTLRKYEYHYGGNMNGNSHRETVEAVDEAHARISVSHAEWFFQDPRVEEYRVDIRILEELKEVFCRYGMEQWHNKEFTDEFVCDGETFGYDFKFDGKPEVWFSSMVFPREYSEKLRELQEIFKRFLADGERLPGLVLPPGNDEEECRPVPAEGKVELSVYGYCCGRLDFRLGNGTDGKLEWAADVALYRKGKSEPIVKVEDDYPNYVGEHEFGENILEVPGQLEAGWYRLEAGGYSCEFEVK